MEAHFFLFTITLYCFFYFGFIIRNFHMSSSLKTVKTFIQLRDVVYFITYKTKLVVPSEKFDWIFWLLFLSLDFVSSTKTDCRFALQNSAKQISLSTFLNPPMLPILTDENNSFYCMIETVTSTIFIHK